VPGRPRAHLLGEGFHDRFARVDLRLAVGRHAHGGNVVRCDVLRTGRAVVRRLVALRRGLERRVGLDLPRRGVLGLHGRSCHWTDPPRPPQPLFGGLASGLGVGRVLHAIASASVSSMVGPMLPATATRRPARSTSWPVSEVVVVLPLVPVIAITLGA
jgi:hypothetical protein